MGQPIILIAIIILVPLLGIALAWAYILRIKHLTTILESPNKINAPSTTQKIVLILFFCAWASSFFGKLVSSETVVGKVFNGAGLVCFSILLVTVLISLRKR